MAIARPTSVPSWASTLTEHDPISDQPNRAEPSAGKMVTGFTYDEQPPRQDVNWLFWLLSTWAAYLDDTVDQKVKTTASPVFAGITVPSITAATNLLLIANGGTGNISLEGMIYFLSSSGSTTGGFNNATGALAAISIDTTHIYSAGSGAGDLTLTAAHTIVSNLQPTQVNGSATGITGTELETLSSGSTSVADALHNHNTVFAQLNRAALWTTNATKIANYGAEIESGVSTDATNGEITVPVAGQYEICVSGAITTASASQHFAIDVQKNGGSIESIQGTADDSVYNTIGLSKICTLAANDVITLYANAGFSANNGIVDVTFSIKLLKRL